MAYSAGPFLGRLLPQSAELRVPQGAVAQNDQEVSLERSSRGHTKQFLLYLVRLSMLVVMCRSAFGAVSAYLWPSAYLTAFINPQECIARHSAYPIFTKLIERM